MTGAGDAVAAGILAAVAEGRPITEGCNLGLRFAALRISDFGDRGHVDLLSRLGYVWPPPDLGISVGRRDQPPATINNIFNTLNQTSNTMIGGIAQQDLLGELRRMIAGVGDSGTREELRAVEAAVQDGDEQGARRMLRRAGNKVAELADKVAAPLMLELIKRWLGP